MRKSTWVAVAGSPLVVAAVTPWVVPAPDMEQPVNT